MKMNKELLKLIYSNHHKEKQRLGFIFGGEERGLLFTEWIGSGKFILDVGCRDGSLTKYFLSGNQVIGADIDSEALQLAERDLGIQTIYLKNKEPYEFLRKELRIELSMEKTR